MTGGTDEKEAERLYPHLRRILHTDDELAIHAKKLYPHIEGEFHQDIGRSVVTAATGMLRKALWAVGGALLALFSFKWIGK